MSENSSDGPRDAYEPPRVVFLGPAAELTKGTSGSGFDEVGVSVA